MIRGVVSLCLLTALLAPAQQAVAHGYELHGSAPYRFGISMYIARTMRVGVTQPVFECWCRRLLWDKVELLVFTRDELNPADDAAWERTKARLESVDLFIVTEDPKQEFAEALLEKANMMYQRPLIYVDLGMSPLVSRYEDPHPGRTPPQGWFSTYTASQLMYSIVNACMRMDPSNNLEYRKNWQDFTTALEMMKRRIQEKQPPWQHVEVRAVSLRGGQEYLMEEAGMVISGVVPPLPDGPVAMEHVGPMAEALRKHKACVLVTTETLDPAVHQAIEAKSGVVVCELEPYGDSCTDIHAFDRVMETNYRRLLDARNAVWAWARPGRRDE